MQSYKKYLHIFFLSFRHTLKNYKALIGLSIFLITCLIIFSHLWKVVAAKKGVTYLDPGHLLWYIAFNEWVLIALPNIQIDMEQDLRSGKLGYLLPRPLSYIIATFSEGLGSLFVNLSFLGIVSFGFVFLKLGLLPSPFPSFLVMLLIGFFAGIVGLLFQMIIGLSAFWVHDVGPFDWIWEKLLFALGGLMIPLSTYPPFLQKIAAFTPFPAILGNRSALALHFTASQVLSITGMLIFWGAIASLLLFYFYRKGLRILNIEGG